MDKLELFTVKSLALCPIILILGLGKSGLGPLNLIKEFEREKPLSQRQFHPLNLQESDP